MKADLKDRRTVLAGLAAGAAAAALPKIARADIPAAPPAETAEVPSCSLSPEYFPNVVVQTHEGRKARFYEDLVRDRTVMIHFFSIAGEADYPVISRLAKVPPLLGDRLGRDIFVYSITVDPERDTPRALRDLAELHGAGGGWLLLTAEPAAVEALKARLFVHDTSRHHEAGPVEDCSRGLVRYGNAAVGLWGSVPAKADPQWIAARLQWVQARERVAGPYRRKGPRPLAQQAWWPGSTDGSKEELS